MQKGLRDANLLKETAFPAAAGSNQSAGQELGGEEHFEGNELFFELPAGLSLVDTKSIIGHVEHSDDDGDVDAYADVPQLKPITILGIAGDALPVTGSDAADGYVVETDGRVLVVWPVPRGIKKFVRIDVAVQSGAGNHTALKYTFGLLVV